VRGQPHLDDKQSGGALAGKAPIHKAGPKGEAVVAVRDREEGKLLGGGREVLPVLGNADPHRKWEVRGTQTGGGVVCILSRPEGK
jgi:hypothetical protein